MGLIQAHALTLIWRFHRVGQMSEEFGNAAPGRIQSRFTRARDHSSLSPVIRLPHSSWIRSQGALQAGRADRRPHVPEGVGNQCCQPKESPISPGLGQRLTILTTGSSSLKFVGHPSISKKSKSPVFRRVAFALSGISRDKGYCARNFGMLLIDGRSGSK